jgi:hypothetical protein
VEPEDEGLPGHRTRGRRKGMPAGAHWGCCNDSALHISENVAVGICASASVLIRQNVLLSCLPVLRKV